MSGPAAGNPLWHPFADMGGTDGERFVLVRGRGRMGVR